MFSKATIAVLAAFILSILFLAGCAQTPAGASAQSYMFWPPAPDAPHLQYLTTISTAGDITGRQGQLDALIYGKNAGTDLPFQRPYGVRFFNGAIYVCDATADCVSILDLRKKQVRILGRTGQVTLQKPIDIAVAPDGIKYVADTGLGAILAYDANDQYAGKFSLPKLRPVSVAVYQNELFVSDITADTVRVFDRFSGKELRTIGQAGGSGNGKIGGAMGIAVDPQGNLFVNDVIGCLVQKFDHNGKFISQIGGLGTNPGMFVRPKLMAIDSANYLYVVDNAFQNVQMFNDQGKLLTFFGGSGSHPGAMDMPAGVCVGDTDLDLFAPYVHPAFELQRIVIVTNNFGPAKINIYGLGQLKPGKTLADISAGRVGGLFGMTNSEEDSLTAGAVAKDMADAAASTEPAPAPATQPSP